MPADLAGPPQYREHHAAAPLESLVACVWTRRGTCPAGVWERNRVLPDGCIDIIFNLGDPPDRADGPGHGLRAFAVGAMREAVTFRLAGRIDIIGVRFAPGGAAALFGFAAGELTDEVVALGDVWPGSDDLLERLYDASTAPARLEVLESALSIRARQAVAPHPAVVSGTRLIEASHGTISVGRLQEALGLSPRHLRRVFGDWVGVSPKLACRIVRLQRAATALRSNGMATWARLAHECGYHDQAHLIREFNDLAGLTPGAYLRERERGRFVQDPGRPPDTD